MQEDKSLVFDSFDTLILSLRAMAGMMSTATFNAHTMRHAAENGHTLATALADWLVMTLHLPFREAHHITGRIVKLADDKGLKLHELPLQELQKIEPRLHHGVFEILRL
jgi:argininosuccinate lyase